MLALAALATLVIVALAACSDDDPLRLSEGEQASLAFRPQLNSFGASAMLPINLIRLTVAEHPGGAQLMDPVEVVVSPTDPAWNVTLSVPLAGGVPVDVIVLIELINETGGVRTIEWSGQVGPLSLAPGANGSAPEVEMFRGSPGNLTITAVAISGATATTEGDARLLRATATGATGVPQFFWSSLDPTIAALDTAAGDSARFLSLLPGVARIVVEAGPRADTLELEVLARVTAIEVSPAQDTLDALMAESLFEAAALDARGDTVAGVAFDWSSSDSAIALPLGGGVFSARATGTVTVTVTTPVAPGVSATAELHVRQVVDSIALSGTLDTIPAGQTRTLFANALDANQFLIDGATIAWSSDVPSVATVDAAGLVTAVGLGTTQVRASAGGVQNVATIVVVPGAVAVVDVEPDSLAFASLGDSAPLTATETDALGNPTGTPITWATRDSGVATVSGAGLVTAVANGATWILATAAGVSDSAFVSVAQVVATVSASASAGADTIAVGGTTSASAAAFDANNNAVAGASFTWTSSDPSVAMVDASGVVTGVGLGTAFIRASSGAASDSVSVTVVAGAAASLSIVSGDAQSGTVATTLPASLVVLVEDAFGTPVSGVVVAWSTANGAVSPTSATTDAAGHAASAWTLGQVAGAQSATASQGSLSATFNATATAGAVDSVDVQPDSLLFTVIGATGALTAGSFDQYGNDCGCTASWLSRDASIATVDPAGVVTAMANGTTWIVADISGIQDSAFVQVSIARAAGATIFWNGATSSDWFDGANWNTGAAPASTDVPYVPAGRPNQPVLAVADTIAGVIVEDGATLEIQDSLVVVDGDVRAGNTIVGTGVLHMIGSSANIFLSGTVPSAILETVRIDAATTVTGTLIVRGVGAAVAPAASLHVTGDVIVEQGIGGLSLEGSLTVDRSMQLLGLLDFLPGGTLSVADSLHSSGFGGLRMNDASNLIQVGGNVRFDSDASTEGGLTAGTIEVAGDWFSDGHSWHASGATLVLNGTGAPQNVTLLNAGHGPGQGHLAGLLVQNPFGAILLTSNLVHGDLITAGPIAADSLIIEGVLDAAGDVTSPHLQLKGVVGVGGGYSVPTTVYFSEFGDGLITVAAGIPYADLVVTADSAALGGDVFVSGSVFVDGAAVVDLMLRGNRLDVGGNLSVVNGLLHLTNAADTAAVVGSASFTGAVSSAATFTAGVVEVGGDVVGSAGAFEVTGTRFVLNGDGVQTITTANPGPDPGFSRFTDLAIDKASGEVPIASHVWITGSLTESSGIALRDISASFTIAVFGDVLLGGDLQLAQLAVKGQLSIGGLLDVDQVTFFGDAQLIPVGPNYGYRSVEVQGTATWTGADSISGDLSVFGDPSGLTLGGNLDVAGHASLGRVVLNGHRLSVASLEGGGVVMTQPTDSLVVYGDAMFNIIPAAEGNLSAGVVVIESGGGFFSVNDGFRSTGTTLVMRGDTLWMENAGGAPGQGQLADLQVDASQVVVFESLFVTGSLEDVAAFGSSIIGAAGTEEVRVLGDVLLDSTSITLNHLALGGSLVLGPAAGFAVDTVQFTGVGQIIPVLVSGTSIPFPYSGTILVTANDVHLGSATAFLDLGADVLVRGVGTTLTIHSALIDGPNPRIGSLHLAEGDASTRVVFDAFINVDDSVRVDAGVLDLNDRGMFVGSSFLATHGFQTAGTGVLEMNQPSDYLEVAAGATLFTGGSTAGLLTMGNIVAQGDFYSENDAFRSTGTSVSVGGGVVTMWNGGAVAGQGGFADLNFGQFFTTLVGSVYVADDISDNADGVQLSAAPGYSLEVGDSVNLTFGASMMLPRLVVHGSLRNIGGTYDVDVTEFVGLNQVIDSTLAFDTIVVTGTATRPIQPVFPADVIARVVHVDGGTLALANGGQAEITDSLIITRGGSFDPDLTVLAIGDPTALDGGLVTADGGVLVMKGRNDVTVNGDAAFAGGSTERLLTDGTLTVRGDFYAENGAFQASGTHRTQFMANAFGSSAITLRMPTGGLASGSDHFNHVDLLWSGSIINVATDLYALGDLGSSSDFFMDLVGTGQRILSDGWSLGGGLTVHDVALEADDRIDPLKIGGVIVDGIAFADYASGVTRLRITHPGQDAQFFWNSLTFDSTDPGNYVEATDSDGAAPDLLNIFVSFGRTPEPIDWASRIQETNGANISTSLTP